jgi:glycosyltransferase involved in cell wall biosynthesis
MSRAIALIAGRDPRDEVSGGHSAYVRSYARAARLAGFLPHLFCVAADSRVEETAFGTVHRVASPVRPFRQLAAGFHAPWLGRAVERFASAAGGAPVLIHGFGVWSYVAARAARRLGRRGVATAVVASSYTTYEEESRAGVRGASAYGWAPRLAARAEHLWIRLAVERWERTGYLEARELTVNYESVQRLIAAKYGAAVRCRRLPYTCESAFDGAGGLAPAAGGAPPEGVAALAPRAAPLLVSVARHQARKGIDVLLRALASLRAAGVPLRACLVGGGPRLAEPRQRVAELGLAGAVVCTGVVESVAPYLGCADVFVLPSREEQSGSLALLEALRAGLPVVASGVDGILEDVADGEDGLLVPPGDPAALAAALARVLADAPLRARLGRQARATYEARFAAPVVAAALAELYGSCGVVP